jgi:hypothetical protein
MPGSTPNGKGRKRAVGEHVWVNDGVGNRKTQYPARLVWPMKDLMPDQLESDDEIEVQFTTSGIYEFVLHRDVEYPKEEDLASSTVTTRSPATRTPSKRTATRRSTSTAVTKGNTPKKEETKTTKSPATKPPASKKPSPRKTSTEKGKERTSTLKKAAATSTPSRKRRTPSSPTTRKVEGGSAKEKVPETTQEEKEEAQEGPPSKRLRTDPLPASASLFDTLTAPLVSASKMIYQGLFGSASAESNGQ